MKQCAEGVTVARPENHRGGRGSIPTSALHFQMGREEDAASLILRYHYSRRIPSAIQFVGTFHLAGGLFGDCGEAIAACVFSIPPTRWAEPVLELSRLVRTDAQPVPLSRLIRLTCIYTKRAAWPDLLVSFADWTQRHHGGVYQAAGWNYDGLREPTMDGLVIGGEFRPGRSCNSVYGTRSPDKLRAALPTTEIEPHYDDGKHLYWKALNKAGEAKARRLGLRRSAYPKPKVTT
jgi:hypothetical protein